MLADHRRTVIRLQQVQFRNSSERERAEACDVRAVLSSKASLSGNGNEQRETEFLHLETFLDAFSVCQSKAKERRIEQVKGTLSHRP